MLSDQRVQAAQARGPQRFGVFLLWAAVNFGHGADVTSAQLLLEGIDPLTGACRRNPTLNLHDATVTGWRRLTTTSFTKKVWRIVDVEVRRRGRKIVLSNTVTGSRLTEQDLLPVARASVNGYLPSATIQQFYSRCPEGSVMHGAQSAASRPLGGHHRMAAASWGGRVWRFCS